MLVFNSNSRLKSKKLFQMISETSCENEIKKLIKSYRRLQQLQKLTNKMLKQIKRSKQTLLLAAAYILVFLVLYFGTKYENFFGHNLIGKFYFKRLTYTNIIKY